MLLEIKRKIYRLLCDINQTYEISYGVTVFLDNETDAKEMLDWLEKNKDKNLMQDEILEKLDMITM